MEWTLHIDDVAYGGAGVGRHDGKACFVPGALPGETVRCEPVSERSRFAHCRLVAVLEPAAARTEPACPLAGVCPGCAYQHVDYATEARLKQAQLGELLRRIGGTPAGAIELAAAPRALGYRNKITLHAAVDGPVRRLGYVGADNRTVIDAPRCPLARPEIGESLAAFRAGPAMVGLNAGDKVVFRHTEADGVLWWVNRPPPETGRLTERTRLGPVRVPARSFFQVNPDMADVLLGRVTERVVQSGCGAVLDFYCGVGLFALGARLAGVPLVLGVDADHGAIRTARQNARELGAGDIRFVDAQSEQIAGEALDAVRDRTPLVIVDPPRQGLAAEMIDALTAVPTATLIYVSCAADTLARDVKRLGRGGYALASAEVLDMFPRTPLFESVVVLRKGIAG